VLEQPAEGRGGGADADLQPSGVQAVGLPAEGDAQTVERTDEVLGLGAGQGRSLSVMTAP
jgi:hypothetical protein